MRPQARPAPEALLAGLRLTGAIHVAAVRVELAGLAVAVRVDAVAQAVGVIKRSNDLFSGRQTPGNFNCLTSPQAERHITPCGMSFFRDEHTRFTRSPLNKLLRHNQGIRFAPGLDEYLGTLAHGPVGRQIIDGNIHQEFARLPVRFATEPLNRPGMIFLRFRTEYHARRLAGGQASGRGFVHPGGHPDFIG